MGTIKETTPKSNYRDVFGNCTGGSKSNDFWLIRETLDRAMNISMTIILINDKLL